MINVVNIWHHYGIKPILRDVSLRIEHGELVAVMGPNGMTIRDKNGNAVSLSTGVSISGTVVAKE